MRNISRPSPIGVENVKNIERRPMSRADRSWLLVIYGTLAIPIAGPLLLIVASSVLYCRWRRHHLERARWMNKHAWIAIGLNALAHVAWALAIRR